ncbi:hypothetical protein G9A89_009182 [Geosiphon pyriformis]|nr:hypothetical protein G9A89_009182 [Geosiphon pyriformis]
MAAYANFGYCRRENRFGSVLNTKSMKADFMVTRSTDLKLQIIIYFRDRKYSFSQWETRKVKFSPFEHQSPIPMKAKVDSVWLENVEKMMPAIFSRIQRITKFFTRNPFEIPQYFFTGHRIGGAYAVLAALLFQKSSPLKQISPNVYITISPINVITFGAPRIGDENFAALTNMAFANDFLYRVTISNDWLPRLFLTSDYFIHHEREIWINHIENCDCIDSATDRNREDFTNLTQVYECSGIRSGSTVGENWYCNVGMNSYPNYNYTSNVPYFGITMGVCPSHPKPFSLKLKSSRPI